jgi:hypothetical protein
MAKKAGSLKGSRTSPRAEGGLGIVALALAAVTLFAPDWIELIFGAEPDGGDGALEWSIVAILGVAGLVLSARAAMRWRMRAIERRHNAA